jgi:hypothetical protein
LTVPAKRAKKEKAGEGEEKHADEIDLVVYYKDYPNTNIEV